MPRRHILTKRQRAALFDLPTDEASLLRHYTLGDDDLTHIRWRRRPENRIGFALQLCALRYPGRMLVPGETVPMEVLNFIGAQLGLTGEALLTYAARRQTRQEHLATLRSLYGYRMFSGRGARDLKAWLDHAAEETRSNEDLARRFVEECRQARTILPAISTIERLCADALVAAERRIESRIAGAIPSKIRCVLDALLNEKIDSRLTRFVWLRQFQPGANSADASRLLDRLEYLNSLNIPPDAIIGIPPHRISRLRRQGERHFADSLREQPDDHRWSILAVCMLEWQAAIADAIVETHDRIVGKTWRLAKRAADLQVTDDQTVLKRTLKEFANLGGALIDAHDDQIALNEIIASRPGWDSLREMVATASRLASNLETEPLAFVIQGYTRFRRYVPRMLKALDLQGTPIAASLLKAAMLVRDGRSHGRANHVLEAETRNGIVISRYKARMITGFWETAVCFHLRDAFRSGDIWLLRSRCYGDLRQALVPKQTVSSNAHLAVPFNPEEWLTDRKARIDVGFSRLASAARNGRMPGGSIEDGSLKLDRLKANPPEGAEDLLLDLYRRMPETRITDILLEVDAATSFTDAFAHLRTGSPCQR